MSDTQPDPSEAEATLCSLFGHSPCLSPAPLSSCAPLTVKYLSISRLPESVFSVSAGESHFALITDSQHLYVCGGNSFGQLGLGHTRSVPSPIRVSVSCRQSLGENRVEMAVCGAEHVMVLTAEREVYAWGLNVKGQLGTGDCENRVSPTLIEGIRGKRGKSSGDQAASISCGALHSMISTGNSEIDKNRVFTCGFGGGFALGHSNGRDSAVLQPVIELDNLGKVDKVSAGMSSSGVIIQGNLYIWGTVSGAQYNSPISMQIPPDLRSKSTPNSPLRSSTPRNGTVQDVCFSSEACVVLSKGEVWAWGSGPGLDFTEPTRVQLPRTVVSIAAGLGHAAAVTEDYQMYVWGSCGSGQICACESCDSKVAAQVRSYEGCSPFQVTCGSYATFCLSYRQPARLQCVKADSPQRRSCTSTADPDCQHIEENSRLKKEVEDLRRQLLVQEEVKEEQSKRRSRSHAYFDLNLSKANPKPAKQLSRKDYSACFEIPYEELEFLGDQIGKGGYGTVYRTKWRGTVVAVKKLRIEMPVAADKYAEFLSNWQLDECQAMASLRHPNIVMFLGACTKPPNLCIILEYCSRGSLWEVLRDQNTPLPWYLRCKIALDTARGMNYLHQFPVPILHRDLKSLNLLLDEALNTKIADFGWTRFKADIMTNKIGTYQWMAPEVISGEQYSEQADVFSFGIILWELATRKPPYREKTGQQVAQEVVKSGLRPPLPKKCPEQFLSLMQRCWDQSPDARPTFNRIIEELEKYLEYLESVGL